MNYLSQVKNATQQLEDKIISRQEWARLVLGEDYANVFLDDYIGRATRRFSIFIKNLGDEEISEIRDQDKLKKLKQRKKI